MSLGTHLGEKEASMDSLVLTNSLNLGPFFSKDLFCDAFFTKDNVALIPIHRSIMAGVSSRFKAIFEEDLDRKVFVVPLVDYGTLKKIVKFIYSNSVSFERREELEDFRTALNILKLEVPGTMVEAPSVKELMITGTDENMNSKEMEQEDPIEKKQEGLVKEKQQDLVREKLQEDLVREKHQEDSNDQVEVEATSLSLDSEERLKLTSRNRSSSRGQLMSHDNLSSSR